MLDHQHLHHLSLTFPCFFPHLRNQWPTCKTWYRIDLEEVDILSVISPIDPNDSSGSYILGNSDTLFGEFFLEFFFSLDEYLIWAISFIFLFIIKEIIFETHDLYDRERVVSRIVSIYRHSEFSSFDALLDQDIIIFWKRNTSIRKLIMFVYFMCSYRTSSVIWFYDSRECYISQFKVFSFSQKNRFRNLDIKTL
jgi:hypothetical protein